MVNLNVIFMIMDFNLLVGLNGISNFVVFSVSISYPFYNQNMNSKN